MKGRKMQEQEHRNKTNVLKSETNAISNDRRHRRWNDVFPCVPFNYISLPSSFRSRASYIVCPETRVWNNAVVQFHVPRRRIPSRCMYFYKTSNSSRDADTRTASSSNRTSFCFCRCTKYHWLFERQWCPSRKPVRALICERKWSLSFFFPFLRSVECSTMFREMIEFRSIYLIRYWIDYTWKRNRVVGCSATKQWEVHNAWALVSLDLVHCACWQLKVETQLNIGSKEMMR